MAAFPENEDPDGGGAQVADFPPTHPSLERWADGAWSQYDDDCFHRGMGRRLPWCVSYLDRVLQSDGTARVCGCSLAEAAGEMAVANFHSARTCSSLHRTPAGGLLHHGERGNYRTGNRHDRRGRVADSTAIRNQPSALGTGECDRGNS